MRAACKHPVVLYFCNLPSSSLKKTLKALHAHSALYSQRRRPRRLLAAPASSTRTCAYSTRTPAPSARSPASSTARAPSIRSAGDLSVYSRAGILYSHARVLYLHSGAVNALARTLTRTPAPPICALASSTHIPALSTRTRAPSLARARPLLARARPLFAAPSFSTRTRCALYSQCWCPLLTRRRPLLALARVLLRRRRWAIRASSDEPAGDSLTRNRSWHTSRRRK